MPAIRRCVSESNEAATGSDDAEYLPAQPVRASRAVAAANTEPNARPSTSSAPSHQLLKPGRIIVVTGVTERKASRLLVRSGTGSMASSG
ncbi:hypothetical protein [Paenarthrobacter sp. Y-19]|uniref:hypothetical protein n=1 Tax=Paenarthrobacter sp. Y-19 TaxID=3031125 RepID=UPI0023DA3486|nr:hypothetical protein [Paenarthrobacter sp. Y-19]